MRKPGEPKTPGLSQEVTLAVLPRLFTEELLSELSRRNIDTNNEAKDRERLVAILKEVMVLEYKEWEEEERCPPSPEIIDITDSSKVDENPEQFQQSQSSSNVPTDQPTCSTTDDNQNSAFKISDSNVSFAEHVDCTSTPLVNNNDSESVVCVPEVIDVDAPEKYLHGLSEIFSRSEQSITLESDAGEKQDQEDTASSLSLAKTQTLTGESEVYPVMLHQTVYQQNVASEEKELPTTTEECTAVSQNGTSEREADCEAVSSESEHQRIMRVISEAKAQVQSHLAGADRKGFGSREHSVKMYSKFKLPRHKQTKKQTGGTTTQSQSNSQAITTHNTLLSTPSKEKEVIQESSNVGNPAVSQEAGMRWKKCYVCGVCGTRASTKFNLIRHMNRKKHKLGQAADLETMASLEMMEVRESNVQFLDTDLSTMEHKKRFTCDDCGYQTSQKSNLVRHKKRKHSGKTATTTKVFQEERSPEQTVLSEKESLGIQESNGLAADVFQASQAITTTTEQLFQEERPTEQTVPSEKESQHMQDSNVQATEGRSEKDFICVECGFQTPVKRNLLRHKRRQHTVHAGTTTKTPSQDKRLNCTADVSPKKPKTMKKIFTCEVCGYQTNQKSNLLRHKRRRHPDLALAPTTGTLSQEDRLKSSTDKAAEVLHSRKSSTGKNFHRCDVCGMQCSTKFNLERHKRRHVTGKQNKQYGSGSKTSTGVAKRGLERRNNTEENVATNNATSIKANNLTTNFDTNIPTSVDTNNATSIDTTSVDTNIATGFDTTIATSVDTSNATNTSINTNNHTSYKPKSLKRPLYTCNLCEYTSAYKVTMKYHKMVHMGEKPYMCGTCGYRATRKPLLVKHMRIHTGDRPYACDQCDYRAIQKVHLNRHVKKKHGMTSAPQ